MVWLEFPFDLACISILLLTTCSRIVLARAAHGKLSACATTVRKVLNTEATGSFVQVSSHKQRMCARTSLPELMAVALEKNLLMKDLCPSVFRSKRDKEVELGYQPP